MRHRPCPSPQENCLRPRQTQYLPLHPHPHDSHVCSVGPSMSSGKGKQIWKKNGAIYEGDWKFGKRDGYGTLSLPDQEMGKYKRVYLGWWKKDKKAVSSSHHALGLRPGLGLGLGWVLRGGGQRDHIGGRRKGWGSPQGFSEQNPGNRKLEERAQGGAHETLWLQEASQAVWGPSLHPLPPFISWLSLPWATPSQNPPSVGPG